MRSATGCRRKPTANPEEKRRIRDAAEQSRKGGVMAAHESAAELTHREAFSCESSSRLADRPRTDLRQSVIPPDRPPESIRRNTDQVSAGLEPLEQPIGVAAQPRALHLPLEPASTAGTHSTSAVVRACSARWLERCTGAQVHTCTCMHMHMHTVSPTHTNGSPYAWQSAVRASLAWWLVQAGGRDAVAAAW